MSSTTPFRFGLQVPRTDSRAALLAVGRRAEELGFDTVVVADHVVEGLLAPLAALAALAGATTRVRLGTLVLNNDWRHPALLAREAATLDLLSEGRLELGVGAGHAAPEYAEVGLPFDPPAARVARLEELVGILRRLFDGETVSVDGASYHLAEHRLFPVRRPRLLVGGNGDRVLRLAAREADIVGFTGLGRTRADGQTHDVAWDEASVDAKVASRAGRSRPTPPGARAERARAADPDHRRPGRGDRADGVVHGRRAGDAARLALRARRVGAPDRRAAAPVAGAWGSRTSSRGTRTRPPR